MGALFLTERQKSPLRSPHEEARIPAERMAPIASRLS